jgi:diacylglycerol kinase (ATP)
VATVLGQLRDAGIEARPIIGSDAADAQDRARQAVDDGASALVAVGGDGTVHQAVNAVAGTSVPLGIVPLGTGNDAARSVGVPMAPPAAVAAVVRGLLRAETRAVDAARTGGRWYVGVLAAGFDARVNERANGMRWPRGPRRYDLATVAELRGFSAIPYVLELDGERLETDAMLVAVGNTPSYGGGLRVCHGALVDDGLLDVLIVDRMSRRDLVRVFPTVRTGAHLRHPAVHLHRARVVSLAAPAVVAYADGERFGALPITIEVVPGALNLLGAGDP